MNYKIICVKGHYEVYFNGKFYCSADTLDEAAREVELFCAAKRCLA